MPKHALDPISAVPGHATSRKPRSLPQSTAQGRHIHVPRLDCRTTRISNPKTCLIRLVPHGTTGSAIPSSSDTTRMNRAHEGPLRRHPIVKVDLATKVIRGNSIEPANIELITRYNRAHEGPFYGATRWSKEMLATKINRGYSLRQSMSKLTAR